MQISDTLIRDIIENKIGQKICPVPENPNIGITGQDLYYNEDYHFGFMYPYLGDLAYKNLYQEDLKYHEKTQISMHHSGYNHRILNDIRVGIIRIEEYTKKIPNISPILDIGCANGGFPMASTVTESSIIIDGMDINPSIIEIAKSFGEISGEFFCGDIEKLESLETLNKKYKCFTFHDVIEHLYYPCQAFLNLKTIAHDEFYIIVNTPDLGQGMKNGISGWKHLHAGQHPILYTREFLWAVISSVFSDYDLVTTYEPIPDKFVSIYRVWA